MDNIYVKGSTGVITQTLLRSNSTGQGQTGLRRSSVSAYYCRPGGTSTSISLTSGSPGDSWVSGKFIEMDSVGMPGTYNIHLPNACFATGANSFDVEYQSTNIINGKQHIVLID